jgi:tetratricopeptide (TPR) repeat protein
MNLKTVFLTAALAISSLGLAAGSDFLLTVEPNLTAQEYASQSAMYLEQAQLEYSVAYADLPLYNRAIANAEAAVRLEPTNPTFLQSAAMLYAKTQWWLPAHQHFATLRSLVTLDDASLDMAALAARKLGYMAMQRGDRAEARTYYVQSLEYRDNASARQMLAKLENTL